MKLVPALLLSLLFACKPLPQDPGIACSAGSPCPAGQLCTSDGTCWVPPAEHDGPLISLVPTHLTVSQIDKTLVLKWDAVQRVAGYRILRGLRPDALAFYAISKLPGFVDGQVVNGQLYVYQVESVNDQGASAPSAPVSATPSDSVLYSFGAQGGSGSSIIVYWQAGGEAAPFGVERADTASGPYTNIATVSGTGLLSFTDTGLPPNTTRYYVIDTLSVTPPPRTVPVMAFTGPPAPAVSASCADQQMTLAWTASAGADGYRVYRDSVLIGSSQTLSFVDRLFPRPGPSPVQYQVVPYRMQIPGEPSALLPETIDVPGPGQLTATSGLGEVLLSWPSVAGATQYLVSRGPYGASQILATTAATSFADQGGEPFQSYEYLVEAMTQCGHRWDAPLAGANNFSYSAPDQDNGGSGGSLSTLPVSIAYTPGQSFVASANGRVTAIEVSATAPPTGSGTLALTLSVGQVDLFTTLFLPVPFTGTPGALGTTPVSMIFPLDLGVIAGEVLTFRLSGQAQIAVGPDTYAAGSQVSAGRAVPGDLVFKSYLTASSDLTAPRHLAARRGIGEVELGWDASPGATSYDVLSYVDYVGFTKVGTTTMTSFIHSGVGSGQDLYYQVKASRAADSVVSNAVRVIAQRGTLDATNLGDQAQGTVSVDSTSAPGQSFIATRAGRLEGIEVSSAPLPANQAEGTATLNLYDSQGLLLGAQQFTWAFGGCCDPPPLSTTLLGSGLIDLGPLNLNVTAGEVLRFEIGHSSQSMELLQTGDRYAGGMEFLNGVAVPGSDLAFKVLIQ